MHHSLFKAILEKRMTRFNGLLLVFWFPFQGDQGFPGEPGLQGERGSGEAGPKVCLTESMIRGKGGGTLLLMFRSINELPG